MGSRRRTSRRTYVTLVAVAGLHAAVFLLLARAIAPPLPPTGRDVTVAPVYLARLEPPKPRRHAAALPPKALPPKALPPKAVPPARQVPIPPVLAAPPGASPAPVPAVSAETADVERGHLAGVLRASRVGCANPQLLSEAERARCERKLADGAQSAKYIPTPLPPERRAFYDAVARAKAHDPKASPMQPWKTPDPDAGHGGSLAALQAASANGIPLFGCKYAFGGPGGGVVRPAHGLKLGPLPCFITPPQGPFTVEANIKNPDTVVRKPDQD